MGVKTSRTSELWFCRLRCHHRLRGGNALRLQCAKDLGAGHGRHAGRCLFRYWRIVVLYEGAHIRITAIYDNVPERVKRWLDLLAAIVATVYLALIGYGAWVNAHLSIKLNETTGTS